MGVGLLCFDFFCIADFPLLLFFVVQVREQGQLKAEVSPSLAEQLLRLEEQAKQDGVGRWNKVRF